MTTGELSHTSLLRILPLTLLLVSFVGRTAPKTTAADPGASTAGAASRVRGPRPRGITGQDDVPAVSTMGTPLGVGWLRDHATSRRLRRAGIHQAGGGTARLPRGSRGIHARLVDTLTVWDVVWTCRLMAGSQTNNGMMRSEPRDTGTLSGSDTWQKSRLRSARGVAGTTVLTVGPVDKAGAGPKNSTTACPRTGPSAHPLCGGPGSSPESLWIRHRAHPGRRRLSGRRRHAGRGALGTGLRHARRARCADRAARCRRIPARLCLARHRIAGHGRL